MTRQRPSGALNVVMLGPPGAGKGTQAERFARTHGLPKISTGDILREAVSAGTDLGRVAKATMDAGELVGDDVMIGIVGERLKRGDTRPGFVLDGFPRTVAQATALDSLMTDRGPLVDRRHRGPGGRAAASPGRAADLRQLRGQRAGRVDGRVRLVRGRARAPERRRRWHRGRAPRVYHRQTRPIVEFYSGRPTFRMIDGNQPPDVVTGAMDAAVREASRPSPGPPGAAEAIRL